MNFNYDNRFFKTVSNTENGETSGETVFHYHQRDGIVWATYQGGEVLFGTLLALIEAGGSLNMRYQQLNNRGEFRTGVCRSTPEVLPDGRYRIHEFWKWIGGDESTGTSVIEEFFPKGAPESAHAAPT